MNHASVDYMNILLIIRKTVSTSSFLPPACMPALIAVPISKFIPTEGNPILILLEYLRTNAQNSKFKV